jgi:hypothetical protein
MTVDYYSDSGGCSNLFGEGDDFDFEAAGITEEEQNSPYTDSCGGEEEMYSPSMAFYEFEELLEKLSRKKEYKDGILILDDCRG